MTKSGLHEQKWAKTAFCNIDWLGRREAMGQQWESCHDNLRRGADCVDGLPCSRPLASSWSEATACEKAQGNCQRIKSAMICGLMGAAAQLGLISGDLIGLAQCAAFAAVRLRPVQQLSRQILHVGCRPFTYKMAVRPARAWMQWKGPSTSTL